MQKKNITEIMKNTVVDFVLAQLFATVFSFWVRP